jgi:CHAT domain-containing protein
LRSISGSKRISSLRTPLLTILLVGSPDYSEHPNLPPLPHAKDEIGEIEKLFSFKSRVIKPVLSSEKATESEFWRLLRNEHVSEAILHIACHGTFEPYEPMNSGLLLADSNVDAAEIYRFRLEYNEIARANEVVLSACRNGWRPTKVKDVELFGDDILGLPGAFLEAEVSLVSVSISRANNLVTYLFMTLYHQNRLKEKTPLATLQETQIAMLSKQEYKPFAWIGFTVYGFQ